MNKNGVYLDTEKIKSSGKSPRWEAEIRVAHVAENDFRYGIYIMGETEGQSYAPGCRDKAYPTKDEAVLAAATEIRKIMLRGAGYKKESKFILVWVLSLNQLALF